MHTEIRRLLDRLQGFILQEKNMQRLTRYQDDVLRGIANDMFALLAASPDAGEEAQRLLDRARTATSTLRDAAREGRVIDFRQRDPLVMDIHNALDRLDAALLTASPAPEAKQIWCKSCGAYILSCWKCGKSIGA